jgi:hypothetical protein
MSRKFVTEKEIAFINSVNKELIQRVSGQEVNYYAISMEETRSNKLYGEAVEKSWMPPVKVNAMVEYDNTATQSTLQGVDSKYTAILYFHTQELIDRNVLPKEGDFIEFGQIFFEITSVTQPKLVFGQVNNKILTRCDCISSREGQFQAGASSDDSEDNSHPVEQSRGDRHLR